MKPSGRWYLVIFVVAFVLRAWNLSSQCLDMDEHSELLRSQLSYSEVVFAADSMPPLYPVLFKTWQSIWSTDTTARWLSLLIGMATIGVVGWLWPRAFRVPLSLATAGLLAISPLHIYYSQYIRSYVLLMFWAALVMGTLAVAVKSKRRSDWVWFGVSALGGLYTHYFFAIFLAVLTLTFACCEYGWKWSRQWWIANLCVGVLALPLISFIGVDLNVQKTIRAARPLDIPALGYTYVSMLTGYSIGPSKRDLQVQSKREALLAALPIAVAVGVIFSTLGGSGLRYLRQRRQLTIFLVLTVVPILCVGLLGAMTGITYNPRFVVWCLLPVLGLLAGGIVEGRRSWFVRGGMLLLVLVSFTAIGNRQWNARYQNEDVRGVANFLEQESASAQPVFVVSNYMSRLLAYYMAADAEVCGLPTLKDSQTMQSKSELVPRALQVLTEKLPTGGEYWLVYTREFHGDPEGELLARLNERQALKLVKEFSGVQLYRGKYRRMDEKE